MEGIADFLEPRILVAIVSVTPGLEPRYAVLYGLALGLPLAESLAISLSSAVLLALALTKAVGWGDRLITRLISTGLIPGRMGLLYSWYKARSSKRLKRAVDRWGWLGLIIFVAIPLPATGIYSGALAAFLLGMKGARVALALAMGGVLSIMVTTIAFHLYSSLGSMA